MNAPVSKRDLRKCCVKRYGYFIRLYAWIKYFSRSQSWCYNCKISYISFRVKQNLSQLSNFQLFTYWKNSLWKITHWGNCMSCAKYLCLKGCATFSFLFHFFPGLWDTSIISVASIVSNITIVTSVSSVSSVSIAHVCSSKLLLLGTSVFAK